MTTESFHAASEKQIDDLLSGDRTRVKSAVDQLPRNELRAVRLQSVFGPQWINDVPVR